MDAIEILNALTTTRGVTGDEVPVSQVVERYFRRYTDDITRDVMGDVIAKVGDHGPTLVICAHMDEVGMLVSKIEENGMLRLRAVGGVDARILPGMEVIVHGKESVHAVMGAIPPHLTGGKELPAYTFEELICDTGLSPDAVRETIAVGDYVTYDLIPPAVLKNRRISGKSFDDRSLITVEILAMDMLRDKDLHCRVAFTGSTQEEVGQRGAFIATAVSGADLGFAMDVTHAPSPGTPAYRTTEMGKISIDVGNNIHPKLYRWICDIAEREGLPYEAHACVGRTGTDAWMMQIQNGGIPVCLASLPLRYMHTSVETIDVNTLENCAKLLAAFILELDEHWEEKLCLDD